ncbi:MAG TPA: peptidylprolyl isomerase, partial [Phycisphaerales bacterium]|nr:peptidylprolyl isomerase [Phycisphaerales bacterium]
MSRFPLLILFTLIAPLAALTFGSPQQQPAAATAPLEPPAESPAAFSIAPDHLYNSVHRPIMCTIAGPRTYGTVGIVLLDESGLVISGPAQVRPGRIDLADVLPAVWDLRVASYIQLIDLDQPVGTPLILQPMLSRLVPVTTESTRPDGVTKYTRITDWRDENAPLPPPPPSQPASSSEPEEMKPMTNSPPPPPPAPQRLFTGFRIYHEQDVLFHTSLGDLRIALRPDVAPNTAWNFLDLARNHFYDGIVFHRIVPLDRNGNPFIIQAGDPTATGDGGPGYWLPMENSTLPHDFGVISMARSDDPDSAGSQFFICLSREGTSRLNGQYCSFGYVIDGAKT